MGLEEEMDREEINIKHYKSRIIGTKNDGMALLAYLRGKGVSDASFTDLGKAFLDKSICEIRDGIKETLETLRDRDRIDAIYCTFEDNYLRKYILEQVKEINDEAKSYRCLRTPSYFHPSMVSSRHSVIFPEYRRFRHYDGIYILPGAIISPKVEIGNFSIISSGANISPYVKFGEGVFIAPGVNVGAGAIVENLAYVGIGATIMDGVKLGEDCIVRAGAVVTKDVPPRATVGGNPTKVQRYR